MDQQQLLAFLAAASLALKANFSCLTILSDNEIVRGLRSRVVRPLNKRRTRFNFSISSLSLTRQIPDLFWATVFGEPYIQLFGRECLMTAPAFQAYSPGNQTVAIQLTSSLDDVELRPELVDAAREAVKVHLGKGAFWSPEEVKA